MRYLSSFSSRCLETYGGDQSPWGAYIRGSKAGTRLARPLAARGYTCISASYRLADEATWPAQLEDLKTCIRWARTNAADLGAETSKIVLLGHSSGGHLALVGSGSDLDIGACVAFYSPAELRNSANPVLGANPSEELRRSYAPINYVKPGFPPTMLLHGTADRTFSVDESLKLYAALRAVDSAAELHVLEGVTHIFDAHEDLAEASAVWIDLFLDRHVANPRTYASTEPTR